MVSQNWIASPQVKAQKGLLFRSRSPWLNLRNLDTNQSSNHNCPVFRLRKMMKILARTIKIMVSMITFQSNHLLDCRGHNQHLIAIIQPTKEFKIRANSSNKDRVFHHLRRYRIVGRQFIDFPHRKRIVSFSINLYKRISHSYLTLRHIRR